MFDIGFLELAIIFVITLVVVGPDRLPDAVKSGVRFITKFKRFMTQAKKDIETQIGADEIRRELHNEEVLKSIESFKSAQQELQEQKRALELRLNEDPTKGTDENEFADPALAHEVSSEYDHDPVSDHHLDASLDHDADGNTDRYPGESSGYSPEDSMCETSDATSDNLAPDTQHDKSDASNESSSSKVSTSQTIKTNS